MSRAGTLKNRSRTSTRVPRPPAAGAGAPASPPATRSDQASLIPAGRLVSRSRATAAIEGSASPRKPKVVICCSCSSASLEVAWRSSASGRSSGGMPQPSSPTRISPLPPASSATSIRVAPASIAFSTSSLTTEAGRSTTSPAAMRLATASGRRRMVGMRGF